MASILILHPLSSLTIVIIVEHGERLPLAALNEIIVGLIQLIYGRVQLQ